MTLRPGAIVLRRSAPNSRFSDGGAEMKTIWPARRIRSVKVSPYRRRRRSKNGTGRATSPKVWIGAGSRGPGGRPTRTARTGSGVAVVGSAVAVPATSARPGEPLDGGHQLVDLLVDLRAAVSDRIANAVIGVIGKQLERHPVKRPLDRGDLGEHVDAVRLLVDHAPQPADLALDPREALGQCVLVVDVAGFRGALHADHYTRQGYPLALRTEGRLDREPPVAVASLRPCDGSIAVRSDGKHGLLGIVAGRRKRLYRPEVPRGVCRAGEDPVLRGGVWIAPGKGDGALGVDARLAIAVLSPSDRPCRGEVAARGSRPLVERPIRIPAIDRLARGGHRQLGAPVLGGVEAGQDLSGPEGPVSRANAGQQREGAGLVSGPVEDRPTRWSNGHLGRVTRVSYLRDSRDGAQVPVGVENPGELRETVVPVDSPVLPDEGRAALRVDVEVRVVPVPHGGNLLRRAQLPRHGDGAGLDPVGTIVHR